MNPTAGTINGDFTYSGQLVKVICYDGSTTISGGTAGTVGPGGTGTVSYRWEKSPDGVSNWTSVAGNGASLTTPNLTEITYYRRFTVVTNGDLVCESSSPTNTVAVYVAYPGEIGNPQTFCGSSYNP